MKEQHFYVTPESRAWAQWCSKTFDEERDEEGRDGEEEDGREEGEKKEGEAYSFQINSKVF